MKTMLKDPGEIVHTASGAVSSGDVLIKDEYLAIAVTDIADTKDGAAATLGTFELPSESDTAWTSGDKLYWDGSELTKTLAADYAGRAHRDKAQTDTTGQVNLNEANNNASA